MSKKYTLRFNSSVDEPEEWDHVTILENGFVRCENNDGEFYQYYNKDVIFGIVEKRKKIRGVF